MSELIEKKKRKPYSSKTITTGDISTNLDFFNKHAGTFEGNDNNNPSTVEAGGAVDTSCDSCAIGESLNLDESRMYVNKIGDYVELPAVVNVVPKAKISQFIRLMDPEERFTVGYITPIYFYKELWDKFTLFKCTEYVGYTGMDYRDVRADEDEAENHDKRIAKAKAERDEANAAEQSGKDVKFDVVSFAVNQTYGQRNKTVKRPGAGEEPDKEAQDLETILFYPDTTIPPKVSYYIDIKNGMGALRTDKNTLEATIYKKVRDKLGKISSQQLHDKIAKVFEADRATLDNVNLSAQHQDEWTVQKTVAKPQVRALYTNQIYYIGNNVAQYGRLLNESLALTEETKRYIKRYYIRPQNIICSNKSEIVEKLAEIGDEDCTIYSLVNLDDHDNIQELTNDDIIYYYEDNVLYDKNHVQIFEYDLSPKHEEERKKFDANKASNKEFVKHYDDRITDKTSENDAVIKEDFNEFAVDFPAPGAPRLARIMCESAEKPCCICGETIDGYGNNAEPYKKGICCDACNIKFVLPARFTEYGE